MAFTAKIGPNVTQGQASIIPDASPMNDGIMTKEQAALLVQAAANSQTSWRKSKNVNPSRWNYPLVGLPNNKMAMFCGGKRNGLGAAGTSNDGENVAVCNLYDHVQDLWSMLPDFPGGVRAALNAVLLQNGNQVLVAGGWIGGPAGGVNRPANVRAQAYLFDINTHTWTAVPDMPVGIAGLIGNQTGMVLMADGRVLICCGLGQDSALAGFVVNTIPADFGTKTAVAYDPASNTWAILASLNKNRFFPSSALMAGGNVGVFGGSPHSPDSFGYLRVPLQDGEVYDPGADTWTLTDIMPLCQGEDYMTVPPTLDALGNITVLGDLDVLAPGSRTECACVLLPDGRILISGGFLNYFNQISFGAAASLAPSGNPDTVLVTNISGATGSAAEWVTLSGCAVPGNNSIPGPAAFPIVAIIDATTVEIYNPSANPVDANNGAINWAVKDVITNGIARKSAIIFDPTAAPGSQYVQTGNMTVGRGNHVLVRQLNGLPLAISGLNDLFDNSATTEEYDPVLGVWTRSQDIQAAVKGSDADGPTADFTALAIYPTRTPDGYLAIGGFRADPPTNNQLAPKVIYFVKQ